jgi:hypothetical protein
MARFEMELPLDLMKEIEGLDKNTEKMLGEMTEAGAKVVYEAVKGNLPTSIATSNMVNCLQITKTFKTPSDDGINTKVAFYGYFLNQKGVLTPAPLVANVFEYGSTKVPKQPFMRKSFSKAKITKAMLEVQKKYIKE